MWPAMLAHTNFILHSAGWLEGGMTVSLEKYVIDAEMLAMFYHFLGRLRDQRREPWRWTVSMKWVPAGTTLEQRTPWNASAPHFTNLPWEITWVTRCGRAPGAGMPPGAQTLYGKRSWQITSAPALDAGTREELEAYVRGGQESWQVKTCTSRIAAGRMPALLRYLTLCFVNGARLNRLG